MRRLTPRDRARQRADFEERWNGVSANELLRVGASEAVLIYPMADQHELLKKLDVGPEACTAVDAYWRYGDNVAFVEVWSKNVAEREPGIYYQFKDYGRMDSFQVRTNADLIDSNLFIASLLTIIDLIDSGKVDVARAHFKGQTTRLSDPPEVTG